MMRERVVIEGRGLCVFSTSENLRQCPAGGFFVIAASTLHSHFHPCSFAGRDISATSAAKPRPRARNGAVLYCLVKDSQQLFGQRRRGAPKPSRFRWFAQVPRVLAGVSESAKRLSGVTGDKEPTLGC